MMDVCVHTRNHIESSPKNITPTYQGYVHTHVYICIVTLSMESGYAGHVNVRNECHFSVIQYGNIHTMQQEVVQLQEVVNSEEVEHLQEVVCTYVCMGQ